MAFPADIGGFSGLLRSAALGLSLACLTALFTGCYEYLMAFSFGHLDLGLAELFLGSLDAAKACFGVSIFSSLSKDLAIPRI